MIREAIDKILGLAPLQNFTYHDCEYINKSLNIVEPPTPNRLQVHSLSGVISYIRTTFENLGDAVIHVVSHDTVSVTTKLDASYMTRDDHLTATTSFAPFNFGNEYLKENFIVAVQSLFVATDNRTQLLKAIHNIKRNTSIETADDGVSQKAVVHKDELVYDIGEMPNPITLKPFRTFTEISQPESEFVLRIKQERGYANIALHEADGGAWKGEAIQNIIDYFEVEFADNLLIFG